MWIKHVPCEEATGELKALYRRVSGPGDRVDDIMLAHSLRPHTMAGHLPLYKAVLHHPGNTVPRWFLEALGVYVSLLNGCRYCVEHHAAGMARLRADGARAATIRAALAYVRKLTLSPGGLAPGDVAALRAAGWEDGQILEINQVAAYFNYANRTVLGLGVEAAGPG